MTMLHTLRPSAVGLTNCGRTVFRILPRTVRGNKAVGQSGGGVQEFRDERDIRRGPSKPGRGATLDPWEPQRPDDELDTPYAWMAALASLGVAETGYLTAVKLLDTNPVCPVSGCENILNSAYAQIFGVPLSALGLATYGAVALAAGLAAMPASQEKGTRVHDTVITAGSTVLAGVSGVLVYLLQTQFQGEVCAWCYASAGISLTLFTLVTAWKSGRLGPLAAVPRVPGLPMVPPSWVQGLGPRRLAQAALPSAGALAVALAALYVGWAAITPLSVSAGEEDEFYLPYSPPEVTTQSNPRALALAQKLRDAGARVYGAFWCSHCADQKAIFGKQALDTLPYVECFPEGWRAGQQMEDACTAVPVRAFPTWQFPGGKVVEGDLTLDGLEAELSKLPPAPAPAATQVAQAPAGDAPPASPTAVVASQPEADEPAPVQLMMPQLLLM